MSLKAVKMLGIFITSSSKKLILEYIQKYLDVSPEILDRNDQKISRPLVIVTPNPEQIVLAVKNSHFRKLLNWADIAIPDGIGVVWANRIIGKIDETEKEHVALAKIPGVSFMEDLSAIAAKQHVPIGLIGGTGGVAVDALECLRVKYSGLSGWGHDAPVMQVVGESLHLADVAESMVSWVSDIARQIKKHNTKIVFIGLGAPKQEYLMELLRADLASTRCVIMAVGGSFNEIAGHLPRAPIWIERMGLKWLWRLVLEPWRWKRQLALIQFVGLVMGQKLLRR